ncbi:MAG TPA: DUF2946 family protein [Sphingomicrobium sp.]|nr:DUF2946 family protein [Sphingomicrobium sp.]
MAGRTALTSTRRACWALAFAVLVAMRLLTPTGFMPAWGDSQVRIILCDDSGTKIGAATHHGHQGKSDGSKHRQSCPYAAASATPFLTLPTIGVTPPLAAASDLLASTQAARLEVERKIERPPSRAPPVLA